MTNDDRLSQIKGLNWLPWIGENYFQLPVDKRLLIVGESHYLSLEKLEKTKEDHSNPAYTRLVVKDLAIDGNSYKTNFFAPLHRCLFGTNNFDRSTFWGNVSFFNLVQQSMGHKKKRPNKADFREGWKVFAELIEHLEPSKCLMVGTSSAALIREGLAKSSLRLISLNKMGKVGNTYTRRAVVETNSRRTIELIFIRHSSQYFSWRAWGKFVRSQMSEILNWHRSVLGFTKVGDS